MQWEETPIQKLIIRPTKYLQQHSHPKVSSQPIQTIVIDRFGKSHKKAMMQEKQLIDTPSHVITIFKETPSQKNIHGFGRKRKAKGTMNSTTTYPISILARANGSFRDQPIRSIYGERIF